MMLNELTIREAHEKLQKKEISSKELTEAVLQAAEKKDESIGAYLSLMRESAGEEAEAADRKIAGGLPFDELTGIPYAAKDNILVKSAPATAASRILDGYRAAYDATVIRKLQSVGAVLAGKTNLDEFAMGSSTEHSAFKQTHNPHDSGRVPGGSSGGSAAAVAAHEAIFALGSDTGGSIRQPAALCGVVGLKPTYGAVSRFGLIAMASSLDQIGSLTKSVYDAALVFDVLKGRDERDATSVAYEVRELDTEKSVKGMRIGLPREYFVGGLEEPVKQGVESVAKRFTELGAEVKDISLPHTQYALATYYIIMDAEASTNLARYDGIRYGLSRRAPGQSLLNLYTTTRSEGFGDEVKRRIILGTYTLSAGYYDAYYLKAQKVRRLIKEDFDKAWNEVDVILTPTTPSSAFRLGEKTADPLTMYLEDIFTVPVNLAGLPAISIPMRGTKDTLPIGFQFIAPPFQESWLFTLGRAYEESY